MTTDHQLKCAWSLIILVTYQWKMISDQTKKTQDPHKIMGT